MADRPDLPQLKSYYASNVRPVGNILRLGASTVQTQDIHAMAPKTSYRSDDTPIGVIQRLRAALLAGGGAISLNTAALWLSDVAHLPTAHGGILKLLSVWFAPGIDRTAAFMGWPHARIVLVGNPSFQLSFHLLVGLLMAVLYALFVSPSLKANSVGKGLICALVVWFVNAAVVLPLTGEGFAGRTYLSVAGILVFAGAHTLFFLGLAVGFERMVEREPLR